jgi:mannitol/fructose-specific phosphotransferase system IIA component (Ntr-type)
MKLTDLVAEGAIVASLAATDRDSVISELIDVLIDAKLIGAEHREVLIAAVLDRERKGSTGFGKGVAVPHVKFPGVARMAAAIGLSSTGIDFDALDKQPVYSVFLLLSPAEKPEEHLQAMEVIFKNLSKDTFRRFLRQSSGVDEVRALLNEADSQSLPG